MISFMLATLGSVTFWVLYFVLGSVVGTVLLKILSEDSYMYITKGNAFSESDKIDYIAISIFTYLFWPIVLVVYIMAIFVWLLYRCLEMYIWPQFIKWIMFIDKLIPTVTFDKKEKQAKGEKDISGVFIYRPQEGEHEEGDRGGFVPVNRKSTTDIY